MTEKFPDNTKAETQALEKLEAQPSEEPAVPSARMQVLMRWRWLILIGSIPLATLFNTIAIDLDHACPIRPNLLTGYGIVFRVLCTLVVTWVRVELFKDQTLLNYLFGITPYLLAPWIYPHIRDAYFGCGSVWTVVKSLWRL